MGEAVYGVARGRSVSSTGGFFATEGNTGKGVYGIANSTADAINYGGYFVSYGQKGRAVFGRGELFDFYAGGPGINYGFFTGAHDVQLDAGFPLELKPGMIVSTAGAAKVRRDKAGQVSLSSTLPTVRVADRPNDKAVFGVLVKEMPLGDDHWYKPAEGERFAAVNALGEGRVWVCDAAGLIEMGDYITTSAVPGYGQLQADDLQHSYTVGKVIESVDWDAVTETIELNGRQYKVYLIAVVYTCG